VVTTIVMVRHGETDWNRDRRFQGHADIPLNKAGLDQVRELGERLAGESFSIVYTSPLRRASETASLLAARLGVEVRPSAALKEVDVGAWSGLTVHEVEDRFPEGFARWVEWRCAGWSDGETYEQLGRRVVSGLREIAEKHEGERVLAVTHGGPIRSAAAAALRMPLHEVRDRLGPVGNGTVVRIDVRDGILEAAGPVR
jgi:2,3-bisphosphoglycerate-dependent phosphoglycerate mutase